MNTVEIRLKIPRELHEKLLQEQHDQRISKGWKPSLASIIISNSEFYLYHRDYFRLVERIFNEENPGPVEQKVSFDGKDLTNGEVYYKAMEKSLAVEKENLESQKRHLDIREKNLANEKREILNIKEQNVDILNETRNEKISFIRTEQELIYLKIRNSYLEQEISEKKKRFSSLNEDLSKIQRTVDRIERKMNRS